VQGIETNVQRIEDSHLQFSTEKSSEKWNLYCLFCKNCDCSVSRSNNSPCLRKSHDKMLGTINSIAVPWL